MSEANEGIKVTLLEELCTYAEHKCQSERKTVIYYIYSKENKYNLSRVLNVL